MLNEEYALEMQEALEKAEKEHGKTFKAAAEAILEFNKGLMDALCDLVPAVKPQSAYYEMYGLEGIRAYYETIRYAKEKGFYVIADGKRNDIGSTSDAYATAFMVVGMEKAMEICRENSGIEAYFIYSDENGTLKNAETEGMKRYY